jgi:hypothetical protein
MMRFYGNRNNVVQFASDLQASFGKDSVLITITRLVTSEDYSVRIVTATLSADTVSAKAKSFSLTRTIT